ncbi:MAG: ABC transporter permease [Myxococcota bacterium]|nr:ABC transporter permease [Myxococcota bacterium]MDW8360994.1 ABC transporter permease [Myxococcales bacterium]
MMDPRAWRRFRRNRGAIVGLALVGLVNAVAWIGPAFAPFDPSEQLEGGTDPQTGAPVPPGTHLAGRGTLWLGADEVGRDELSRLLAGTRISLLVAFGATLLAVALGVLIGILAGYAGGPTDTVAMRSIDLLQSLPFLLVAIALNRVIDRPDLWVLCLVMGGLSWTTLARVMRAKTLQVRELEYVQAARALGAPAARLLLRHVLPNAIQPALVLGTTLVAQMIIFESAMSYLGLGVRPPTPSLGSMLHSGQQWLTHQPVLVLAPSALIVATVFGFNLLGEGLRDVLDPKD